MTEQIDRGLSPVEAVAASLPRLKGAFALAFLFEGEDDLLIGARRGAPLAVGYGEGGEMYLGSDALALAPFTDTITYLEDGDWVILRARLGGVPRRGQRAGRRAPKLKTQASAFLVDKGNYRHFMAKEIHEQPEVVGAHARPLHRFRRRRACGCPSSCPSTPQSLTRHHASPPAAPPITPGMIAKYWFERFARLPVEIDVASEFRYREAPLPEQGLMIVVSQSGETADTLAGAALRQGAWPEDHRRRQCADLDHRARKRRRRADARRAGNRRRLDQGLHLPARRAGGARAWRSAARAACSTRRTRSGWSTN